MVDPPRESSFEAEEPDSQPRWWRITSVITAMCSVGRESGSQSHLRLEQLDARFEQACEPTLKPPNVLFRGDAQHADIGTFSNVAKPSSAIGVCSLALAHVYDRLLQQQALRVAIPSATSLIPSQKTDGASHR